MGGKCSQMVRNKSDKMIVVLGVGIMGSGISCAVALSGIPVTIWNRRTPERAIERIGKLLDRAIEKNELSETRKEEILSLIRPTTELHEIANSNFVIESVIEDLQIKKQLLNSVGQICPANTILATNTSSLSVTEIASATKYPEQVIGMHFFNPAHKMELVELILTRVTSQHAYEQTKMFVQQIGKTFVTIDDSVGSVVNRILLTGINEAISILAQSPAKAEEIDKAMCLGANYPMGPLRLADFIGLDVCAAILDNFYKRFGEGKFRPHPLLIEKVQKGFLGRKTGQGFFCYERK